MKFLPSHSVAGLRSGVSLKASSKSNAVDKNIHGWLTSIIYMAYTMLGEVVLLTTLARRCQALIVSGLAAYGDEIDLWLLSTF